MNMAKKVVGGRSSLRMSILNQLKEDSKVIFLTENKYKIHLICRIQFQKKIVG